MKTKHIYAITLLLALTCLKTYSFRKIITSVSAIVRKKKNIKYTESFFTLTAMKQPLIKKN